jgi:hypothetical protein
VGESVSDSKHRIVAEIILQGYNVRVFVEKVNKQYKRRSRVAEENMPDRDVKTLQDLIWYQYAKIIARSALGAEAKGKHYGFIKKTFQNLKSGKMQWSYITREDWQLVEAEKCCVYCGKDTGLSREHLVPKTLRINDRCPGCDVIQSIHNQVWSCRECNSRKGTQGLYVFYSRLPGDGKFHDRIPPLAEKKYLKTVYECLSRCTTRMDRPFPNDQQPTVLDLDDSIRIEGHL